MTVEFGDDGAKITIEIVDDADAFLHWTVATNPVKLLKAAYDARAWLEDNGIKRVMTTVSTSDKAVYEIAERFGFVPSSIMMVLPLG